MTCLRNTSALSGMNWVTELLNGNPTRIQQEFRMNKHVFLKLCDELVTIYGFCLPPHESSTRDQNDIHPYIQNNQKYRVVKDCIGAIDGTHVVVRPKPSEAYPYYSRKGCYTTNIYAACDFDMCFTYISYGWEDSMHSTRIFYNVVHDIRKYYLVRKVSSHHIKVKDTIKQFFARVNHHVLQGRCLIKFTRRSEVLLKERSEYAKCDGEF